MSFPQPKVRRHGPYRLGLKYGVDATGHKQSVGWAILRLGQTHSVKPIGELYGIDPVEAAVQIWRNQDEPRPAVVLYRFATQGDFEGSRFARDGGTLADYRLQLAKCADALRKAGADVSIISATAS